MIFPLLSAITLQLKILRLLAIKKLEGSFPKISKDSILKNNIRSMIFRTLLNSQFPCLDSSGSRNCIRSQLLIYNLLSSRKNICLRFQQTGISNSLKQNRMNLLLLCSLVNLCLWNGILKSNRIYIWKSQFTIQCLFLMPY